jgi:hypothetical protein
MNLFSGYPAGRRAKLEGAVTTDICGKKDSHALRLDKEAVETIRKARLHQKVATTIFFESNGGQAKAEATLPEIRLAVAEPDLDIGTKCCKAPSPPTFRSSSRRVSSWSSICRRRM